MALLEVDRLASFYGDFQALFDVSLAVDEGETVAVIGANGAGKSTLLRTVAGLQDRATGTVAFDGRPLDGVPTHRRLGLGIAMVPEGRRIFPSLTVEENLKVGAAGAVPAAGTWPRCWSCSAPWPTSAAGRAASCPGASSRCWPSAGP